MRSWSSLGALGTFVLMSLGCPAHEPGDAGDLLAVVPADVDVVAFVDVLAVQEHPLWKKVQEDPFLRAGEETLGQLQEMTGLDPFRDLHMLLFAARHIGKPDMEMAVFARGLIDRGRISRLLKENGWEPEPRGRLEFYSLGVPPVDDPGIPDLTGTVLAFLDDYTVAVGPARILEDAAQVAAGRLAPLVDTEDIGPLIEEGLGSGQFWGVFRAGYLGDALRGRIEEGIPMMGVLKGFSGMQVVRFSTRFSDSIDLVARARTGTEEEAQLLADTLNGFLALAKLAAQDRPAVQRFLEGTLVGLDLDSVRLSMNVDAATLDQLRGGLLRDLGVGGS